MGEGVHGGWWRQKRKLFYQFHQNQLEARVYWWGTGWWRECEILGHGRRYKPMGTEELMNKRLPGSGTLWVEHAGTQQLQIELPKLLNLLWGWEKKSEERNSLMVTVILSGGTGNSTNSLQPNLWPRTSKISSQSLRFTDLFGPIQGHNCSWRDV